MTKDVGSYSVGFFGGLWYGKESKQDIKKNELVSGDVSDDNFIEWDLASEKSEEFRIIENTFKGPGSIDKVFEWHSKNK